jgi:hypothetical protein
MTLPPDYGGRARRRCPSCDVEIEVTRPQRPIGKDSTRSARKSYTTELRRQILWEATCPNCRDWWNVVISRSGRGFEETDPAAIRQVSEFGR